MNAKAPDGVPGPAGAASAADAADAPADRHVGRSTAVTSIAQVATLGLGALFSIVILLTFGKNSRTDGLLAAYGVYSVVVLFAQSFRTAAVARLVEGERPFSAYDRFLGGVLVLFVLSGLAFVVLGSPLSKLLIGDLGADAHDTARVALLLLWPAAGAQLVAALTAAQLGVRGEFALPGGAFVVGGLLQIALALALSGPLGHDAVAVSVAVGALTTALVLLGRLVAVGYRPRLGELRPRLETLRTLAQMVGGATAHLTVQLTYLISLAFAARIGPGAVTLYTYAFFANSALVGATSGSLALVLAAPIADTWDRRPRSLDPHLRAVVRAVLLVLLPLVGAIALIGVPAIELLLGSSLDHADAVAIVGVILALSGTMLASAVEPVPMLAAFASSRYGRVALLSLTTAIVQTAGATIALSLDSLVGLGLAASAGSIVYVLLLLRLIYGRELVVPLRIVARELVSLLLPAAALFAAAGLLADVLGGGWRALAATFVAGALYVLFLRARRPEHWALMQRIVPGRPPQT
jgi:peptidoglycan biosynthesis protein MviN/MurJ (putative lipid II flippase)